MVLYTRQDHRQDIGTFNLEADGKYYLDFGRIQGEDARRAGQCIEASPMGVVSPVPGGDYYILLT